MKKQRRYLSIKWQAFALASLVLWLLCGVFLFFSHQSLDSQYLSDRAHAVQQFQRHLDSLIELESAKLIQFAHTATLSSSLSDLESAESRASLEKELKELAWTLQIETGVDGIEVFDQDRRSVVRSGRKLSSDLAEKVLAKERPHWEVSCDTDCFLEGATPFLSKGKVAGAIVISQPLGPSLLRFRQIAKADAGLLVSSDQQGRDHLRLDRWKLKLVALTNPGANQSVVIRAAELDYFDHFESDPLTIRYDDSEYELSVATLKAYWVLVISDVSAELSALEKNKWIANILTALVLVISEIFLLLLLWRPMSRLRTLAQLVPGILAREPGAVARYDSLSSRGLFRDESDVFRDAARELTARLEDVQYQLAQRAERLQLSGEALEQDNAVANQLFDQIHAIVIIQDLTGKIVVANELAASLIGVSKDDLVGRPFGELLDSSLDKDALVRRMEDLGEGLLEEYQHENALMSESGEKILVAWRHTVLIHDESDNHKILSVAVDCQAMPKSEQEQAWSINRDEETGFYSKARMEEELLVAFECAKRNVADFGLIVIQIDVLSLTDSSRGRSTAFILRDISAVFRTLLRGCDFVARPALDEFVILARGSDTVSTSTLAKRLQVDIDRMLERHQSGAKCRIGFSNFGENSEHYEEVYFSARSAVHAAKNQTSLFLVNSKSSPKQ